MSERERILSPEGHGLLGEKERKRKESGGAGEGRGGTGEGGRGEGGGRRKGCCFSNHEQGPDGIVQENNGSNKKHGYASELVELCRGLQLVMWGGGHFAS